MKILSREQHFVVFLNWFSWLRQRILTAEKKCMQQSQWWTQKIKTCLCRLFWIQIFLSIIVNFKAPTQMVHSKLQVEVLKLYKELLRAATNKPGFQTNIRSEFRRQAALPRHDSLRIEYQMRLGRRKLDTIRGYLTVCELVFLDEENLDGKYLDYQHLDHTLIWQRLAPKHLLARLTRTMSNSGMRQSRQALPGWA